MHTFTIIASVDKDHITCFIKTNNTSSVTRFSGNTLYYLKGTEDVVIHWSSYSIVICLRGMRVFAYCTTHSLGLILTAGKQKLVFIWSLSPCKATANQWVCPYLLKCLFSYSELTLNSIIPYT